MLTHPLPAPDDTPGFTTTPPAAIPVSASASESNPKLSQHIVYSYESASGWKELKHPCIVKPEPLLEWRGEHAYSLRPLAMHFATEISDKGDSPLCLIKIGKPINNVSSANYVNRAFDEFLEFDRALLLLAESSTHAAKLELLRNPGDFDFSKLNNGQYEHRTYEKKFDIIRQTNSTELHEKAKEDYILAEGGPSITLSHLSSENNTVQIVPLIYTEPKARREENVGFLIRDIYKVNGRQVFDEAPISVNEAALFLTDLYKAK